MLRPRQLPSRIVLSKGQALIFVAGGYLAGLGALALIFGAYEDADKVRRAGWHSGYNAGFESARQLVERGEKLPLWPDIDGPVPGDDPEDPDDEPLAPAV